MSTVKEYKKGCDIFFMAQVLVLLLFWSFVIGLSTWLVHLLQLALELKDTPGFSMAICLVAIPVFWTLAGVLTYVLVGLRINRTARLGPRP